MEIQVMGIDLGKTFHLVGVDSCGNVVVRKRGSRSQLLAYTANVESSGSVWMRFVPIKTEEHWICGAVLSRARALGDEKNSGGQPDPQPSARRGANPKNGRK